MAIFAYTPADASAKKPTGLDLYLRFAFAGAVCCSVTHGALTPVDVVKTRIQLDPQVYNKGMVAAFGQIVRNEGYGALLTGLGPTLSGYFIQGALKFGGYEFWKKTFVDYLGQESAQRNRTAIYLGSSAIAEFFADVALCPLEATRIRLVSQPDFAKGLVGGFSRILREEGVLRGFYSGFGPILFKQVPYTMAKFVVFEIAHENISASVPIPKEKRSNGLNTTIALSAGLISGIAAAIISQPADTLLSKINKQKGAAGSITSRLIKMAGELGFSGLFTGLGARIVMVGTLTAGQFAIYGDIKALTEEQTQEYREAFSLFDKKGNQTISSEDIGNAVRALGQNPTQAQLKELIKSVDPTGGKPVTFDEFLKILTRPDGFKPQGTIDEFVQGFQVFDKDSNGYISVGELRYVLTSLGEKLRDEEVDEMLKAFAPDKDGYVHYEEFVKTILTQ